jgi:threonylcarbamoyladenosine tRNA methylthiotransferase MtaB
MKISILTLGCKVNQAESSILEGSLIKLGHSIANLSEQPDYCVINSCTVTAKSDYQSRQLIRRAVRTGAKVIVTGCYSQIKPDEIKKIEGVNDVVPNSNKYNIINIITNNNESYNLAYSRRSRPYIKVQDGCNYGCTYCIVPKARGKSRSTEISKIIEQISSFESQGYSEIVLTGIHLGSYGYDLKPQLKLSNLLKTILKKTTIHRIRLSSIEVNEIDNEIIELLKEKRICNHMHVPLQSGDNTILNRMKRRYISQDFVHIINKITKTVPDIALGTDVIVGFPGEGEKEFKNTMDLLGSLPITYMHIFPFSQRPGTLALQMPMQNTFPVKSERVAVLNTLHINKKTSYMNSQAGKILDIIIEEKGIDNNSIGTSGNYLKVKVHSHDYPRRTHVYVRVTGVNGNTLEGIPIYKT